MTTSPWGVEKATNWYQEQPWRIGCNFLPSTAINQLEMWQAETFDLSTIDRELGWAADLGFNTMRVYLHDLAWQHDRDGFLARIDAYLDVAYQHGIHTLLVLFDDCWNKYPYPGPQPAPIPGVHNSGWSQSPGEKIVLDATAWESLEQYVSDIVRTFAIDNRVWMWDLYNEPGAKDLNEKSLPLLKEVFEWARHAAPTQPLTSGVWADCESVRQFQTEASDVISFHHYGDLAGLECRIANLKPHGRPLICTEYMARTLDSRFETHLPVFRRERIACYNWGLVSGKSQTIYPWGSEKGAPEPDLWFHDIFRPDGTPFDPQEIDVIKHHTQA